MSKKINLYYAKVDNMGDILNVDIIKKCFGYDVIRNTYLTGIMSGIGSGLGNYTYDDNIGKNILKFVSSIFFPTVHVWGTGFINYRDTEEVFYKRNMHICAVRGKLSKARVEKIMNKSLDVALGDAGILASYLLDEPTEKRYDVGIIAHYKEQDEDIFQQLLDKHDKSVFIDVRKTPYEVTSLISECRYIISSSLHGLIIADSLRVPNIHLVVTDKLLGDGFKFDDYYSAYDLKHKYVDCDTILNMSLDDIADRYEISDEMVDKVKKNMLKSFPFRSLK